MENNQESGKFNRGLENPFHNLISICENVPNGIYVTPRL